MIQRHTYFNEVINTTVCPDKAWSILNEQILQTQSTLMLVYL